MIREILLLFLCAAPLFAEPVAAPPDEQPKQALPAVDPDSADILLKNADRLVAVFQHKGIFVSEDGGTSWSDRTKGLPLRIVYPDYNDGPRTVTSLDLGGPGGTSLLLSTPDSIWFSEDLGKTWKKVHTGLPIKYADFFSAVALHPESKGRFLMGTSFTGIFETKDAGKTWKKYSEKVKGLYRGAGFYEDVAAVGYCGGSIAFITGWSAALYVSDKNLTVWNSIALPATADGRFYTGISRQIPDGILVSQANANTGARVSLTVTADNGIPVPLIANTYGGHPANVSESSERKLKDSRIRAASDRHGIYVAATHASGKALDKHIGFMEENGLNSMVVDFKDDTGKLTYNSTLALPKKLGAINKQPHINLQDLVKKAHDHKLYLIARIVVFKDEILYNYDKKKLAIKDKKGGTWGKRFEEERDGKTVYVQREFWVDPYNPEVWEYNAAIAKELQKAGVDEIQFDYIRFPSDGDLRRAVFPARKPGQIKIDALESFLRKAREEISIPISTDIYGFNGWYRMGNWIGQSLDMLKDYVDVVCPMFYPSHFPGDFLSGMKYLDKAERIYHEGSDRAAANTGGSIVIRPYVQAFLLPGEYYMEEPVYSAYLRRQLDGTIKSSASGFTMWNQSNRYYMVVSPLNKYTGPEKSADRPD